MPGAEGDPKSCEAVGVEQKVVAGEIRIVLCNRFNLLDQPYNIDKALISVSE